MGYPEIRNQLFQVLVKEHLKLKKPIGSKILAKKKFPAISPATLRLYLSRLVAEGLLQTVNFYSGKIPTDQGWYYYFETTEVKDRWFGLDRSLEKSLATICSRLPLIACLFDSGLKIKGLRGFIKEHSAEIEVVEEALYLLEKPELMIKKVRFGVDLLIGQDLQKSLSLFAFKNEKLFFGILAHKRIDYPIIWSIFKEILAKSFHVRAEKPRKSKRNSPGGTSITFDRRNSAGIAGKN